MSADYFFCKLVNFKNSAVCFKYLSYFLGVNFAGVNTLLGCKCRAYTNAFAYGKAGAHNSGRAECLGVGRNAAAAHHQVVYGSGYGCKVRNTVWLFYVMEGRSMVLGAVNVNRVGA